MHRCRNLLHDFNPRPPRGERHFDSANALTVRKISIHALREESDRYASSQRTGSKMISIHALREESDLKTETAGLYILISIHALREESDASRSWFWPSRVNFNPRPPRGERPRMTRSWKSTVYFNPRPPRGERQLPRRILFRGKLFQSTPSARRATHGGVQPEGQQANFNPRPPRGERQRGGVGFMLFK